MHSRQLHEKAQNPFKCTGCTALFTLERDLKEHQENVHKDKPEKFNCDKCRAFFKSNSELQKHNRNIHMRVKVDCWTCGGIFHSKHALQTHIQNYHRNPLFLYDNDYQLSKKKVKKIVYESVDKFAFSCLLERGAVHSKSKNNINSMNKSKLKTQPYLLCEQLSREEAQLCFSLRSRSLDLKNNFKSKYKDDLSCRTCESGSREEEQHLLLCSGLEIEDDVSLVKYEDVFSDLKSQIKTTKIFKKILRKREIILSLKQDQPSQGWTSCSDSIE